MNAASLQKRVDNVFKRVGGMDRTVYIRTYTEDPTQDVLIGSPTVTSYTDTAITPQPTYKQLSQRELMYLTADGNKVTADDYRFDISPLAISEAILENNTFLLVLKSGSAEEAFRPVYVNTQGYQGAVVLVTIIARSVENTA